MEKKLRKLVSFFLILQQVLFSSENCLNLKSGIEKKMMVEEIKKIKINFTALEIPEIKFWDNKIFLTSIFKNPQGLFLGLSGDHFYLTAVLKDGTSKRIDGEIFSKVKIRNLDMLSKGIFIHFKNIPDEMVQNLMTVEKKFSFNCADTACHFLKEGAGIVLKKSFSTKMPMDILETMAVNGFETIDGEAVDYELYHMLWKDLSLKENNAELNQTVLVFFSFYSFIVSSVSALVLILILNDNEQKKK